MSVSYYEEYQNGSHLFRTKDVAVATAPLTSKTIVVLVHRCIPLILVRYQANTVTVMLIITIPMSSSLLKFRIRLTMEGIHGIYARYGSIFYWIQ